MFAYDSAILAAVSTPPSSIDDVLRIMRTIDSLCADIDGLRWFNGLYLQVTESMAARCAGGGFQDVEWLLELDVQFAALYFAALAAELSGGRAPGCWRALFDRRGMRAIARVQFAMAGVNAHINHDLAIAIGNACRARGMAPAHGSVQYVDYCGVNSTLESLVDTAKQELAVRLPGDDLPPVSHLEDTLAAFSVTAAREAAWNNAEMLAAVRGVPLLYSRALTTMDGITAFAGKALLAPVPAVRMVAG